MGTEYASGRNMNMPPGGTQFYVLKAIKDMLLVFTFTVRLLRQYAKFAAVFFSIAALPQAFAMNSSGLSKPPLSSGNCDDYSTWWIAFAGFIAWKLSSMSDILEGDEPEPAIQVFDTNPAEPSIVVNQAVITLATNTQNEWRRRNRCGSKRLCTTHTKTMGSVPFACYIRNLMFKTRQTKQRRYIDSSL
jgi:hypothetical protein